MANSGIHGQLLEVTVVGCNKLKDTEWISRQDPYVCIEYGSTKFRTRTCTDGGKNPTFQEKFMFNLIEGLREINVLVWNSNTLTFDDFIGSGKAQLQKVLSQGFDDSPWPLQTKSGRHAGEVRLIIHYPNANKPAGNHHPSSAPQLYGAPQVPQVSLYSAPPPPAGHYPPPPTSHHYPQPPSGYPSVSPYPSYHPSAHGPPPPSGAYPPAYPPSSAYPPQQYPPPPQQYPPPPQQYPPPPQQYPPPPQASPHYTPPGPYGVYPPRPY